VRAVLPQSVRAGRIAAGAVVHILALNLLLDGNEWVMHNGSGSAGVACEFRLEAAAVAAGGLYVSTRLRVVSSVLATCEVPEARAYGMAPVRVSLAGTSSASAATFACVQSPILSRRAPPRDPAPAGASIMYRARST